MALADTIDEHTKESLWLKLRTIDDSGRPELNGRVGLCEELIDHPTMSWNGKYVIQLDPIEGVDGLEEDEVEEDLRVFVDVRSVRHFRGNLIEAEAKI